MVEHTSLRDVVNSNATTAYDRLRELQSSGIAVAPIPFQMWRTERMHEKIDVLLHPHSTTLFDDGWERYSGIGTCRDKGFFTPIIELYVAGHNAVYRYDVKSELANSLTSLRKQDGCDV